jgi:polyhydroxybutyrate depolymerase
MRGRGQIRGVFARIAAVLVAAALLARCGAGVERTVRATGSGCHHQAPAPGGHSVDVWLHVNPDADEQRTLRSYRLHEPTGYVPTRRTPLVLFFHGAGGSAEQADRDSGWSALADRDHFLVGYPQGLPFGRNGPSAWASAGPIDFGIDDLAFVRAVLKDLEGRACIQKRAIFATGMSSGGGMAGYLACSASNQISAAAPIAANNYVLTKLGCRPSKTVSILEVHGTADQVVPYYGTSAKISPQWPLPSITHWISTWARRDHCHGRPATNTADHQTQFRYQHCGSGSQVILYRLNGAGHAYPRQLAGRPADAVIYQFFNTHSR